MKTKHVLSIFLSIMAGLIISLLAFPEEIETILNKPSLYPHTLFVHVLGTTLFFANAIIGIFWELKSLATGRKDIILHTYETVSWLDAHFSSLLIIISVVSGIMLSVIIGNIWEIGWLSHAFVLFLLSGIIWVISDIPTQYKVKKIIQTLDPEDSVLPPELMGILKKRLWISLAGVLPLVMVFILMIYKPAIPPIANWF